MKKYLLLALILLLPLVSGCISKVSTDTNKDFREWISVEELTNWCKGHLLNSPFTVLTSTDAPDCYDYAKYLQQEAVKNRYYISLQVVYDGVIGNVKVTDFKKPHMGNIAIVGKDVYYIEPQPKHFNVVKIAEVN